MGGHLCALDARGVLDVHVVLGVASLALALLALARRVVLARHIGSSLCECGSLFGKGRFRIVRCWENQDDRAALLLHIPHRMFVSVKRVPGLLSVYEAPCWPHDDVC